MPQPQREIMPPAEQEEQAGPRGNGMSMREVVMPAPTGRMPDDNLQSDDPNAESQATPEEQQFYDIFMSKAIQFIHGPKSSRQVLKHLNQTDLSVPEAVGRTAAMIAGNVLSSAQQAKQKVYPEAVLSAGQEIVEELLDLGSRAGVLPIEWPEDGKQELTPEQEELAQQSIAMATKYFGDDYLKTEDGKALQGEAQTEMLRQIQNEAKAGTINPDFMVTDRNTVEGGVKRALLKTGG